MAKPKVVKTIYRVYFNTDRLGEADGFFEVNNNKVKYVTGWFHNDAMWRGEYMTGLMTWAGVEVKILPEKLEAQAEEQMAEAFGL